MTPTARMVRSGLGEGYPDPYYGETPETMAAVAPRLLGALEPVAADLRGPLAAARLGWRTPRA